MAGIEDGDTQRGSSNQQQARSAWIAGTVLAAVGAVLIAAFVGMRRRYSIEDESIGSAQLGLAEV